MYKLIEYFSKKTIFANLLMVLVFVGGVVSWNMTNKEDMPNITFDFLLVSAPYPGATPEEVEHFITRELEQVLQGIDGVDRIQSTSTQGRSSISVYLTPFNPDREQTVQDIKDAVDRADIPEEIDIDPTVREFKSSRRSIVDLMMADKNAFILNEQQRRRLQQYGDTLKDRLLALPQVSEVSISNYIDDIIEINVNPDKLVFYNISLSEVIRAIQNNNVRRPLGVLDNKENTRLTLLSELDDLDELKDLIIRGSFEGKVIRLKELAAVERKFKTRIGSSESLMKVNGKEAIMFRIVKTTDSDIINAIEEVKALVSKYQKEVLSREDTNIDIAFLDDESISIKNRLNIIAQNGMLGFLLIIVILLIFLDMRSGFWVAMGIPFSFGFTMILAPLFGHTINNMTLAAVIIVMGMVVDDAIVVAENVSRLRSHGISAKDAVVKGTSTVLIPITASIVTTCAAFLPLFFFSGRFGMMTVYLPPIIFLMLAGSLLEALVILPCHLKHDFPRWLKVVLSFGTILLYEKYLHKKPSALNEFARESSKGSTTLHWFFKIEDIYGSFLKKVLKYKWLVYIVLALIVSYSAFHFTNNMKFSMFPREETTEVVLLGELPAKFLRNDTELASRQVDEILNRYIGTEIIGFRSRIGQRRRGGEAHDNFIRYLIELKEKENRTKSTNQLIKEWEKEFEKIKDFKKLSFSRSRFGQDSGSPIDIVIKENNDQIRRLVAESIVAALKKHPDLENAEIESQLTDPEYKLDINRELVNRLHIDPSSIGTTLRAIVEGVKLFELKEFDKVIEVILSVPLREKKAIQPILRMPVQNNSNYLVPLKNVVRVTKTQTPRSINSLDGKRVLHVYADIKQNSGITPLEIAEYFENNIFPQVQAKYPSSEFYFGGEVEDSRKSGKDFLYATIFVIILIYAILALTLDSLSKPFIIMLSIPLGVVGIILAFKLHGIAVYGFFSAVGALGLAGVVVNDSIVMLDKLEREFKNSPVKAHDTDWVADIAKTRLRAVLLTTITTVAGLMPTAYGIFGFDSMLSEMMLAMSWGLIFGTVITLIIVPVLYSSLINNSEKLKTIK